MTGVQTCALPISPAQAAEAIGVTFLMNGGPATVYGARAFSAFQEFYREHAGQPDGQRQHVTSG